MTEDEKEVIDPELFEEEIRNLEKKTINWKNNDGLIAFYGSSSLRLWSTLEKDLTPLNTVNLGFGGSSFGYCLYYFERIFQDGFHPSRVVIYAGDNDIGKGLAPEVILHRFRKLVDKIREKYSLVRITFVTIKPSPERDHLLAYTRHTNNLIRKELLAIHRADMINVFDSMLDEKGKARPELYQEDQLHLNENGYRIWKGVFRKHFGI
ncbi:MAG: GDSL-type esterase/lipase family protein [Bacteroidota bacterium]